MNFNFLNYHEINEGVKMNDFSIKRSSPSVYSILIPSWRESTL